MPTSRERSSDRVRLAGAPQPVISEHWSTDLTGISISRRGWFVVSCAICVGCGTTTTALTRSTRTYEEVGGAALGTPERRDGRVHIPIRFDLDGGAFWHTESASEIRTIDSAVDGRQITLSVVSSLVTDGERAVVPHELVFDELDDTTYSVSYRDPDGTLHEIGNVTVREE